MAQLKGEHHIVGPPGTGKTTTLVRWVADAVKKYGRDRVLVSSLTKTAAQEIRSRGVEIAKHNVGTLHSICYRMLGSPPLAESAVGKPGGWNELNPSFAITSRGGSNDDLMAGAPTPGGDKLYERMGILRARCAPR